MSAPISIRLDDEINKSLEEYTKAKGISKTEFIRTAIIEKLEDDYDITMADKAYTEWVESGKEVMTFNELVEKYG